MKEVFININDGFVKWWAPNSRGSEPFSEDCSEVLGRSIKMLTDLAASRGEEWSFRINRQPRT